MTIDNSTPETKTRQVPALTRAIVAEVVAPDTTEPVTVEIAPETSLFGTPISDEEFDLRPTPVDWLVKGLFARGDMYVMYGRPGSKKTWVGLDLAVAISLGQDWLGMGTKQSPVLIVDEESGPDRLKRRMYAVRKGHLINRPLDGRPDQKCPMIAFSKKGANFADPEWVNALSLEIQRMNVGLVIVDSLVNVSEGVDENDAKSIQPILRNIRNVAIHTKATVIVLHHSTKNGENYRGSTAIESEPDMLVKVESETGSKFIKMTTSKERDHGNAVITAEAVFVNTMQDGEPFLEQAYLLSADIATNKFTDVEIDILTLLFNHTDHTTKLADFVKEVVTHNGLVKPEGARTAIKRLDENKGLVERVDGPDGKEVRLTEKGLDEAMRLVQGR